MKYYTNIWISPFVSVFIYEVFSLVFCITSPSRTSDLMLFFSVGVFFKLISLLVDELNCY